MTRKPFGLIFLAAAIFAFTARYLNAVIYILARRILRTDLVGYLFEYLDQGLWRLSVVALIFSFTYFIWGLAKYIRPKIQDTFHHTVLIEYSSDKSISL